jgi:hypothetical protein
MPTMSNDLLIDKRIIERNIKKGRVNASEHRSMLEALPDLRGQLWQRPEPRAPEKEVAPPPAAVAAPTSPVPPAPAYPSEPEPAAEPAVPLPSTNQPSPFG